MPKKTGRFEMRLDPDIQAMLERVGGNRSDYVSTALRERWQTWTQALEDLRSAGWRANEVKAACDALNGYWMVGAPHGGPQAIALELHDAQRLNNIYDKWNIPPKRWQERTQAVASNYALSSALGTVVREFWAFNAECERAIEKLR